MSKKSKRLIRREMVKLDEWSKTMKIVKTVEIVFPLETIHRNDLARLVITTVKNVVEITEEREIYSTILVPKN